MGATNDLNQVMTDSINDYLSYVNLMFYDVVFYSYLEKY